MADEKDNIRETWLKRYLYVASKAIKAGYNVKGYFYWSLFDNFEWDQGFYKKFGIYKVDLNTKTAPLQLFVTGLVFALVFDTTTQITAWGLIEGQSNQYAKALYIGLAFTLGMILTDTLNSFLFVKILKLNRTKMNFKNILAILVIISSLLFALLQTMNKLGMEFELSETSKLIFGITTLAITLSITVYYSFIKPRV